ncbi:MAG: signal peptidase II [Ruminococcaceae bacterium]|nr:signal peptidase II [Oscillospiraceae bacterium]
MYNLLFVVVLVALDQWFKHLATKMLVDIVPVVVVPHFIGFNYVHNYGAGFSILSGKVDFLIVITAVALLAIAVGIVAKKFDNKIDEFSFVLILAGGIGNLVDRVVNGYVVDYLEFLFMEFPIFNFADILICTGVGLFVLNTIITEFISKKKKGES